MTIISLHEEERECCFTLIIFFVFMCVSLFVCVLMYLPHGVMLF